MEYGGNGLDELLFFVQVLDEFRPQAIFEWGTNRGGSARAFYEIRERLGFPCRIVSADNEPSPHYATSIGDRVELLLGDGPELCIPLAKKSQRTLFFVDGHHDFENVTREITMVAEGCPWSWMMVHDTQLAETRRAILEWELLDRYTLTFLESHAGIGKLVPA